MYIPINARKKSPTSYKIIVDLIEMLFKLFWIFMNIQLTNH